MSDESPNIPSTHRSWQFNHSGSPRSILTFNEHVPTPHPATNHLLIRVHHATLNGGSAILLSFFPSFLRSPPCVPGNEFAGTVVAVGPTYAGPHGPDTRIYGSLTRAACVRGRGVLTEYMLVCEDEVVFVPVPDTVPLDVAAALPGCGSTVVSMCKKAGVKGGERVLVYGASGGVGSLLVQVLHNLGVREIVGVTSGKNIEMVKNLGVDQVLDYTAAPIEAQLKDKYANKPFDIVMDTVGIQTLYTNSPHYLKEHGVFMNVGGMVNGPLLGIFYWFLNANRPVILGGTPRQYIMFSNNIDTEQLGMVAHWAEEGKLKAPIEKTFAFEEVLDAFDLVQSGRVRGKVIIDVAKVT